MSRPISRHRRYRPARMLVCAAVAGLSGPILHAESLDPVQVSGSPIAQQLPLPPASTASLSRLRIQESIDATSAEDTLKYLPSLTVRKRNPGDTQSPLATRTSGLGASARSLIYVDGILLSALIGNNNTYASPRWNMVSPDAIEQIDVMYGPFSAAYAGNSTGAVVNFVTREPRGLVASASVTGSHQQYDYYGHGDGLDSNQASFTLGDRIGAFSWLAGFDHLDTHTQPIAYATALVKTGGTPGASGIPVSGARTDSDRYGRPIEVFGATTLLHYNAQTARLRLGYELLPKVQLRYQASFWQNDASSDNQSFLLRQDNGVPLLSGAPVLTVNATPTQFASVASAFASGYYSLHQQHTSQALSLIGRDAAGFDWELIATRYDIGSDDQRNPSDSTRLGAGGTLASLQGTGWKTLDAKFQHRLVTFGLPQTISAGLHQDHYILANPTYTLANWASSNTGTLRSDGEGRSATRALWAEDRVQVRPDLRASAGVRAEWYQAYGGLNVNGTTRVDQPGIRDQHLSPKLSLSWDAREDLTLTGSIGRAYRFPTVGELYQLVSTGSTFTAPNPRLQPEAVVAQELALEHVLPGQGHVRLSLFQEEVANALLSQFGTLPGYATPVSFTQNVDQVRARGVELAFTSLPTGLPGLTLDGSATWVDSRIEQDTAYQPTIVTANGATVPTAANPNLNPVRSVAGKRTPGVPSWRATLVASWRPDERWVATLAGRYSGPQFSTIDNFDTNGHTYQGFESYVVFDARLRYRIDAHFSAALSIDNLANRQYWLFHPFPQRTFSGNLRYEL